MSKKKFDMKQPHCSLQERRYSIRRRAPSPPKLYANTVSMLNNPTAISSDFVYVKYINKSYEESNNIKQCLVTIVNKLIDKEELYILKLKSLMKQLEMVSTSVCCKLPLLQNIFDFHTKVLIKIFFQSCNPLEISELFQKYKTYLELYVLFTDSRKDFSYLVTDLCENIIDNFKARLLEYKFTISQIKNVCNKNIAIRMSCSEAEDIIKNIYQNINEALKKIDVAEDIT